MIRSKIPISLQYLFILWTLLAFQACNNGNKEVISKKTLVLSVTRAGNDLTYAGYRIEKRPFYSYKSGSPLYEAELFDHQGKNLQTVLFGKIFFIGNGPEYQLTFPYFKNLDHILIYRLNPGSGHITNKDRQVALNWKFKLSQPNPEK